MSVEDTLYGIPLRKPWGDFPAVIRNGDLGELSKEPEYVAAKAGDSAAALQLVRRIMRPETVEAVRSLAGDKQAYLLPVLAVEETGRNKLPLAAAMVLSAELGLPVELGIVQADKVFRTNSGSDHRLAFNPRFSGPVVAGRNYILLDDTLSMGGTIASLRGFVEHHGGHALGAVAMVAHPGALELNVKSGMLQGIAAKHGAGVDQYWKETFGYGIDCLTQGEAGHLRAAKSADDIRARIAAARDEGLKRMDGRASWHQNPGRILHGLMTGAPEGALKPKTP